MVYAVRVSRIERILIGMLQKLRMMGGGRRRGEVKKLNTEVTTLKIVNRYRSDIPPLRGVPKNDIYLS